MDEKRMKINLRRGYASLFSAEQADEVQDTVFPELDNTVEFDIEEEAEDAISHLRSSHQHHGDYGVRLRNFDAADEDMCVDIARAIKGYWESLSLGAADSETIIIVSGTDSLGQYEPDLSGRVYSSV